VNDVLCVGVCMIDPDTGACLGCGRLPEEIDGIPVRRSDAGPAADSHRAGLPPAVAAAAAEPTD
jgi:uncharacterized protein